MNETPPYLRDLHRLPLADLARIGASCGTCAGKGTTRHSVAFTGDPELMLRPCEPCAGTGRHGGHLRTLPNNALIALCAALARDVWAGDDPLASAEDRAFMQGGSYVLPRRAGRVFFGGLPMSRFPAKALRLIGNDPRDSPIDKRIARHALACRSLFGTLLAEAGRRRLLPAQQDLQVAWDAALARGHIAPDADRELLLAEAWVVCVLDPGDRREAETDASAWLERLQAIIGRRFQISIDPGNRRGGAVHVGVGGETYTVSFTDDLTRAADIAHAINELAAPVTASVEDGVVIVTAHEDAHRGTINLPAPSRRPEAREPVGAPLSRPVGRALSRRLEGRGRRT